MLAGWLGYQLRALPARVCALGREWTTRVVEVRDTHPLYEAWLEMMTESAVRIGGPRTLEVRWRRQECEDEGGVGGPRGEGWKLAAGRDEFWSRARGKLCRVRVLREGGSANRALAERFLIEIEMLFGTRADVAAMAAAAAKRADVMDRRQVVDLYDRYGGCTTVTIPKRDPATLCLPRGAFEGVEARLREFGAARERHERAGIPWRFGVMISGEPGTGKTSLCHALASRLGLRLAVITLADLESDQELVSVFRGVTGRAMVLIEDIDCALRQREGESAAGVSFSGFLNCIDGVLAPHNGRVLVMTTNHADLLDPALIRPGRVDLHIRAPLLGRQEAADYADRVFPLVPSRHDIVRELMEEERPTPAMLINRLSVVRGEWGSRRGVDARSNARV